MVIKIVVDNRLSSLYYKELIPLDYTLEEVKRLNEATAYSHRIGKIEGKNVAIIGIPNPNSTVSRIQFKKEKYRIAHIYEKITEEEAKDKTFTVYPFTTHDDTQEEVESVFEQEIIPIKDEEVLTETKQEPSLVKTMRPQNNKN